jgi:UDP-N-acetylenolpyruvoylglucosamine reductase
VPLAIRSDVLLAPRTTFELGGPARFLAEITETSDMLAALEWAKVKGLPIFVRLARHVCSSVFDRFAIELEPEPVFLGLDWHTD